MEAANERGEDMAVFRVIIVPGAVQVGGHRADGVKPVWLAVCLAHDAGDFCQGIGIVGLLQRAREQALLLDRLGAQPRIDAGRTEEEQLLAAVAPGAVDNVVLDLQILEDKFRRIGGVGKV